MARRGNNECSLKFKKCPSAKLIRDLLVEMHRADQPKKAEKVQCTKPILLQQHHVHNTKPYIHIQSFAFASLFAFDTPIDFEKKYSVVQLLDAMQHLKYEHGVDQNDDKFDEIYDFFKYSMKGKDCDINECKHALRHYSERRRHDHEEQHDHSDDYKHELLLSTMAMIHCYFVHSFDIDRLTKEERERVKYEVKDQYEDEQAIARTIINMRVEKRKRFESAQVRFSEADDEKTASKSVDFLSMANVVGVDVEVLRRSLQHYRLIHDPDQMIHELIDVVYGENEEKTTMWELLDNNMEDKEKRATFRRILFEYFSCSDLNNKNFMKMSDCIIERKGLKIDVNKLFNVLRWEAVDGEMFDHMDTKQFKRLFVEFQNGHGYEQDVNELYTAMKSWTYIESGAASSLITLKRALSNRRMSVLSHKRLTTHGMLMPMTSQLKIIESVPLLDIVIGVVKEMKAAKKTKSSALKAAKMERFGDQIIEFFSQKPDFDDNDLTMMTSKQFGLRLAEHCGDKRVIGITAQMKKV